MQASKMSKSKMSQGVDDQTLTILEMERKTLEMTKQK
jgi:hypothetical protein